MLLQYRQDELGVQVFEGMSQELGGCHLRVANKDVFGVASLVGDNGEGLLVVVEGAN